MGLQTLALDGEAGASQRRGGAAVKQHAWLLEANAPSMMRGGAAVKQHA